MEWKSQNQKTSQKEIKDEQVKILWDFQTDLTGDE